MKDRLRWVPRATVRKYDDQGVFLEEVTSEGNLVTTAGLDYITNVLIGAGNDPLDDTVVRLGVGDDSTAATPSDTDLSTATDQYYQVMDATFPTQADGVMTFKSTYGPAEANFEWACWGLDAGTPTVTAGTTPSGLLNRKVFGFGEKDGGTWDLTVQITLE